MKMHDGIGIMGGIIGDICGSIYEFTGFKTDKPETINLFDDRCTYTDDTLMYVASARGCLHTPFVEAYKHYGRLYPDPMGGYGAMFKRWLESDATTGDSFGNGAAARAGSIGYIVEHGLCAALRLAKLSAQCSHGHPEGVKGATAVVLAIQLAKQGNKPEEIVEAVSGMTGYDVGTPLDVLRKDYKFDETCQGTVPVALRCFLEAKSFAHAIQLAISMGGDADTLACITGALAGACYPIPDDLLKFTVGKLQDWLLRDDALLQLHFGTNPRNALCDALDL